MIAWFARNPVAANIVMAALLGAGTLCLVLGLPLEVFPTEAPRAIQIDVELRGANPEEVERSITTRLEQAVADLATVDTLTSTAREGGTTVTVTARPGSDPQRLLDEVKTRIDAIGTLPERAERPVITLAEDSYETIAVIVSGDLDYAEVRQYAERVRRDLLAYPEITQVSLDAAKREEIAIEISPHTLRQHGLSLEQVAQAIRNNSLDASAGNLRGKNGDILVRSSGQAFDRADFDAIVVRAGTDGSELRLGHLATVVDGFEEDSIHTRFNGQHAVFVAAYRVGDQSALDVADAVRDYLERSGPTLPQGIHLTPWDDESVSIRNRIRILLTSALQGALIVLIILSLFLHPRIALWTFIGIPVSFLGSFLILSATGTTLNQMSVFGYILVLGIVVDDAIVTSESVHRRLRRGQEPLQAAIDGTHDVAAPVTFGVLTTAIAFTPLWWVDGVIGRLFAPIATVVVPVLLLSLVESKLVLPAHLAQVSAKRDNPTGWRYRLHALGNRLEQRLERGYRPALEFSLQHPGQVLLTGMGALLIATSLWFSGRVPWTFFPTIERETATAALAMPAGTPLAEVDRHITRIGDAAQQLQQQYVDPTTGESLITNIIAFTGATDDENTPSGGEIQFEMQPLETRTQDVSASELVAQWRELSGPIPGAESLEFSSTWLDSGSPLAVELRGDNRQILSTLARQLRDQLGQIDGVYDIADDMSDGKRAYQVALTFEARALGFERRAVLAAVANALRGLEVQRIQRGRSDIRVLLRYPAEFRDSFAALDNLILYSPQGHQVPASRLVTLQADNSPQLIQRREQQRVVTVTAQLDESRVDQRQLQATLTTYLEQALAPYPGVSASFEGQAREERRSVSSLNLGALAVLGIVYCLLALPLRSYTQPLLILAVIPFGLMGAITGHLLLGYSVSILSLLGMLALAGVVINDSLVLLNAIQQQCAQGKQIGCAVRTAALSRLRPVALTSITTFAGLTPLMLEPSTTAQFLIPMAISLAFGIVFATVGTLLIMPAAMVLYGHKWRAANLPGDTSPLA